ncbi:MAG: 2-amino-4-hydroxy-6-hydroxymethyldihydropteridine diphosphokinase [Methylomonas sp.]|nr:2-amino-4-hydroxy-6-hydroxymethyldihydropteridine diphosphokinase [Methylomonas sp.]PPD19915.1 MAG: 2-amino-4-hydroxy-6-hydroxymethyldihydropteridine diphosphokinase [Methylomonas sp.]PPD26654.1 MAG: 2-amino-4-hydroxy-6-hydroxymethyldihydropteridine diphosphokinase [Methylomonas sp.]PPD38463.1 MAG: 2-amino-4-hydroxy-6-hydroxymethyldihydropteridine diphosphokinase [Methylomonas sp.]PPD39700.1 MAG: 2-amino-4-hydroxy-6-hydroxymethyldihydropteridine diphosphokinase [Methylomonas sp.]
MTTDTGWVDAYLGLGSNLDDPVNHIRAAVEQLAALDAVKTLTLSPLYLSAPQGPQDQPDYINAALHVSTCLSAFELLNALHAIENRHGRQRQVRWGARTLDLDILLYDNQLITSPDLTIPHRELANRAFVLYPLNDICDGTLAIPGHGNLADLLEKCPASGLQRLSP